MTHGVGSKARLVGLDASGLPRAAGRLAIWAAIGLLLVRGAGSVLGSPDAGGPPARAAGAAPDLAAGALAVRFARAYLAGSPPRALASLAAEGAGVGRGPASAGRGALVAQAEVSAVEELGGGRSVLTVACELRDARTLFLAVPISRSRAGEVAVQGAPWLVAAPSTAGVAAERPRPLGGPEAGEIGELAGRFLRAYVSARRPADLSYLLAPGAAVAPLGGSLEPLSLAPATQLGNGAGRRRTVVAAGRFRDAVSGTAYRLAYRLELVRRERWYVRTVQGARS